MGKKKKERGLLVKFIGELVANLIYDLNNITVPLLGYVAVESLRFLEKSIRSQFP